MYCLTCLMYVPTLPWQKNCKLCYIVEFVCAGLEVTFCGNPGHGSAFIQNNAAEKLVRVLLELVLILTFNVDPFLPLSQSLLCYEAM